MHFRTPSEYVFEDLEHAFEDVIFLTRGFLLHEKVSLLRSLRRICVIYGYIFEKALPVATEPELLQSHRVSVEETFGTVIKSKVLVERWRREYNHIRPHSSLGYGLRLRRSSFRWERRCSVPLRSTAHLRLETNSGSGTKYGGRALFIYMKYGKPQALPLHRKIFSLCSKKEVGIHNTDIF
jgi:hypothetical protein